MEGWGTGKSGDGGGGVSSEEAGLGELVEGGAGDDGLRPVTIELVRELEESDGALGEVVGKKRTANPLAVRLIVGI